MTRAEMRVLTGLVVADVRRRPGRLVLTIFATVAAACVVVWVVSGYDSLVRSFKDLTEKYLGRYDALILPAGGDDATSALSQELISSLRQDPAVVAVDRVFQAHVKVMLEGFDKSGAGGKRSVADGPVLVGTDAAEPPYSLIQGRWIDPSSAAADEAAVSKGWADAKGVKLGDEVFVAGNAAGKMFSLRVVGIVEQRKSVPKESFMIGLPPSRGPPLTDGPAEAALYVSWTAAKQISGKRPKVSFAGLVLAKGIKIDEFRAHWTKRLEEASAEFQAQSDVGAELNQSSVSETVRGQALAATGIALLAALFIIFAALSMGVDERIRQFAMLRAVALTRQQIGAMIAIEAALLGAIGWAGGLMAGWGLLTVASRMQSRLFPLGVSLGGWCVALSGVCALGGSLAAAAVPAWRAMRVSPLEAMTARSGALPARFSRLAVLLAVLLVSVNPLVVFCLPMRDTARYGVSAFVGCPAMVLGFVLLAQPAIALTETLLAPLLARLLRLNSQLLSTQLTTNVWRTTGTTAALTIGLGLFVAMQTWGYSMLAPFVPGDWAPDMVVAIRPACIPDSEIDAVRHIPGIVADQCLPLAVEQTKFADDVTGARERISASRQDNCVMVGVDPEKALGGGKPMFDFQFLEGTRAEALEKLKRGRYCLVPDHFQRESGLGVGGKFTVIPPESPRQRVEYEIAGVVAMPGWHWMSKVGLRNRGGDRSAGLMFAGFSQVRRDFSIGRICFFWMNLTKTASEKQIKDALQAIAQRNSDLSLAPSTRPARPSAGERPSGSPRQSYTASVNIQTVEGVRKTVTARADGIIWALSVLPLVTLCVASLGVVNAVFSSVRARRWDMGVLRALGMTRFGLVRLVLAEAVLIGVTACLLSLGLGVEAGYCGTGITRYVNIRGGMITPLVLPWAKLCIGFGITVGLCLLAALWPAVVTGRTEPLKLLQAGRYSG
jgi:putative ABC transport system permease protein